MFHVKHCKFFHRFTNLH